MPGHLRSYMRKASLCTLGWHARKSGMQLMEQRVIKCLQGMPSHKSTGSETPSPKMHTLLSTALTVAAGCNGFSSTTYLAPTVGGGGFGTVAGGCRWSSGGPKQQLKRPMTRSNGRYPCCIIL